MSSEFNITSEALANIVAGSYEQLTGALEAHISESFDRVFGAESVAKEFRVVATFPTHVVAVSESGEFRRVAFHLDEHGQIYLGGSSELSVPVELPESGSPSAQELESSDRAFSALKEVCGRTAQWMSFCESLAGRFDPFKVSSGITAPSSPQGFVELLTALDGLTEALECIDSGLHAELAADVLTDLHAFSEAASEAYGSSLTPESALEAYRVASATYPTYDTAARLVAAAQASSIGAFGEAR